MRIFLSNIMLPLIAICAFVDPTVAQTGKNSYRPNKTADIVFSVQDTSLMSKKGITQLSFYYHDSLGWGHPFVISRTGASLDIDYPVMLFESSHRQTPFLVHPGDSIEIRYAGTDSVQFYMEGNTQGSHELNFFRVVVLKTGNLYPTYTDMPPYHKLAPSLDSIHQLEKMIYAVKTSRLTMLNEYVAMYPISENFRTIALNSISSKALWDSVFLYTANKLLLNKLHLKDSLIKSKIHTLNFIGYVPFQIYYQTCKALTASAITDFMGYSISKKEDVSHAFYFIAANYTGVTRDFLMSNILYTAYNTGVPITEDVLNRFHALCKQSWYLTTITAKLSGKDKTNTIQGGDLLRHTNGKQDTDISQLIKDHKGQIILLDFWASWCAPCRAELPYSRKLKNIYKDKPVSFIFISTDSNSDDWLKANRSENLPESDSYLLLNSSSGHFVKQYNLYSIPRYLLIDKNGKVVNSDAPRPSDQQLTDLLDRYLH